MKAFPDSKISFDLFRKYISNTLTIPKSNILVHMKTRANQQGTLKINLLILCLKEGFTMELYIFL